jgi:hypothetical protein
VVGRRRLEDIVDVWDLVALMVWGLEIGSVKVGCCCCCWFGWDATRRKSDGVGGEGTGAARLQ